MVGTINLWQQGQGSSLNVDSFEMVLVNRLAQPTTPTFCRANQLYVEHKRIEEGIALAVTR